MKPLNVLSLFDGISCGQLALSQLKIPVAKYYASEIEQSAIAITKKNFPNTIQLGYVQDVKAKNLPKIDLILAGSPCQGFSFNGKRLNFEDPRSKLFWEFVRVLKECRKVNPNVKFLLENVRMKKESENIITKATGVKPVFINSKVLSAQSRGRLYWCNWIIDELKPQPKVLKDILQQPFFDVGSERKMTDTKRTIDYNGTITVMDINKIAPCLSTTIGGNSYPCIAVDFKHYRRPTAIEIERLQTLPDNYTYGVSKIKRVHAVGNGWTVSVIKHILKSLYK